MRSFRNKVVSAVAWAVPVFAAALPGHAATEVARPQSNLLQLDVQPNYAQATFSVPCTGCLGHGHTDQHDESLVRPAPGITAIPHSSYSPNLTPPDPQL
jgi:hypothetical protein